MKKIMPWIFIGAIVVFVIDWGVAGLKILDGNYDIMVEGYIGIVSWVVLLTCGVYRSFTRSKCVHCGKVNMTLTVGKYCSHCGKSLK